MTAEEKAAARAAYKDLQGRGLAPPDIPFIPKSKLALGLLPKSDARGFPIEQ